MREHNHHQEGPSFLDGSVDQEAAMESRRIVRALLAVQLCALGMGVFATDTLARVWPAPVPSPGGVPPFTHGVPAGIPEPGKYIMTLHGGIIYGPFGSSTVVTVPGSDSAVSSHQSVIGGLMPNAS